MFIATANPNNASSGGAKCDSPDIFRCPGACPIIPGFIVYKHFVPTGLRVFFSKTGATHLTEHYQPFLSLASVSAAKL